ncbi:Histidine--tRNA ligase, mitochondrial [Curvularia clavata]|uniref:histidine--tRNA ligase n=1 Tax=Curvularia clavata TaxID=95742 RepID=A0A9Q8Z9R2_CURCL|nr:Histidine--tRNA ligase, mitochondrial [Curvularia clavata]
MPPQLKTPKGTRDWHGEDITLRNDTFAQMRKVFRLHGGEEIDTPAFELKSYLTGKYGEDTKLIYDLQDQGGEICALRYDLTVPFARWLGMHNTRAIKRFQIGKVYRRDQPALKQGRMREFFQCDFDYAGQCDLMVADSEVVCIAAEVFEALGILVVIRTNHRLILDGIFAAVGVPKDLIRPISSAVDKLDKLSWEEVKKEMEEKGLDASVAARLGEYVLHDKASDTNSTLEFLKSDVLLSTRRDVQQGVKEMELLVSYLRAYNVASYVQLDLSLARGLDYYTGLIYEVVATNQKGTSVGSIAAGGRYDKLVGMFSNRDVPCVGISFGVDRILAIIESRKQKDAAVPNRKVNVWIVIASDNVRLVEQRMAIARELRSAGISVDFDAKADKKPRKQMEVAEKSAAVVVFLEEDTASQSTRVKVLSLPDKTPDHIAIIERQNLVDEVKQRLTQ